MELAQVQPNLFSYGSLARSAALWQQGVQVLHAVDARRLEATWSHSFFRFLPVIFRVIHGVVHKDSYSGNCHEERERPCQVFLRAYQCFHKFLCLS